MLSATSDILRSGISLASLSGQRAMEKLQQEIERWYAAGTIVGSDAAQSRAVFFEFRQALTRGQIRAAEKLDGRWRVNAWVKQGILLGFRLGELQQAGGGGLSFVDKDTFPTRGFSAADRVRVVPGGSSVREGAFLAPGVICMPPMYVNAGAYVDEGTLIDSHALVGSCAQVGKRVHLSAAAQIGPSALLNQPTRCRRSCGLSTSASGPSAASTLPATIGAAVIGCASAASIAARTGARTLGSLSANPSLLRRSGRKICHGRGSGSGSGSAAPMRRAVASGSPTISSSRAPGSARRWTKDELAPFSSRRRTR